MTADLRAALLDMLALMPGDRYLLLRDATKDTIASLEAAPPEPSAEADYFYCTTCKGRTPHDALVHSDPSAEACIGCGAPIDDCQGPSGEPICCFGCDHRQPEPSAEARPTLDGCQHFGCQCDSDPEPSAEAEYSGGMVLWAAAPGGPTGRERYPAGLAEPSAKLDAAWEALAQGVWDGPLGIESIRSTIARHRPAIEAAIRPLDVERLARAYNNVLNMGGWRLSGVPMTTWRMVAREYAALVATPEPK